MPEAPAEPLLLLMDTCGDRGWVAVARGDSVVRSEPLPERMASAGILAAIRIALDGAELDLQELQGVGVVNGPGSFTGLRVGLAVAKGLCEARQLPLATVSRLAVLAESAGLQHGFAALRAGRDQVYACEVREGVCGREQLLDGTTFLHLAAGLPVAYAELSLLPLLEQGTVKARFVSIDADSVLAPVRRSLRAGGTDVATADANYVRDEGTIYMRASTVG